VTGPRAQSKAKSLLYASIVSANPETLDGLQTYLGDAGVPSHCTRAIRDIERVAPPCATATIIFPDDFEHEDILALVRALRRRRPHILSLIVTREPQRFFEATKPDGRSVPPTLLPKPSFGWDILDAIRAHADESAG